MYGEVVIKLDEGKPGFEHGPAFVGKLDPWNHDTFRASFNDACVAKMLVTFSLGPDGRVANLNIVGLEEFERAEEDEAE